MKKNKRKFPCYANIYVTNSSKTSIFEGKKVNLEQCYDFYSYAMSFWIKKIIQNQKSLRTISPLLFWACLINWNADTLSTTNQTCPQHSLSGCIQFQTSGHKFPAHNIQSHYIEWTNDTKKADVSSGNLVDGVTQFWPIWVPDTTWSCQNQTWSSWSYIKNSFTSTLTLQRNTKYNTFLEFFSSVCPGKVNRNWNMDQISHCIIFQKCYVYHNSSTSRLKKNISLH